MIRKEVIEQAHKDLAEAYRDYTLEELRWDWGCRIRQSSRDILANELKRRGVSMEAFNALGRGVRRYR